MDGAVVIPAVAPSSTFIMALTCAADKACGLPVPLDILPIIWLATRFSIFSKVTVLSPTRAIGSVPDVISLAFSAVRFAPLVAGNVAGNLPFGIVPESSSSAFNDVSDTPEPTNLVAAVTIPACTLPT